jgi:phage terminase small subunit
MTDKPLSRKHLRFIDEYLKTFNGTRAYMVVYPKAKYDSAGVLSANLLGDIRIKAEVDRRLAEVHMSADEALKLLAEQARGDIGEVMDVYSTGFNLDMQKAKELGLTKLIKKVRQKTTTIIGKKQSDDDKEITELEVELYDSQAAIDKILKVHGKYTNTIDLTSGGKAIKGYEVVSPDDWKEKDA